MALLRTVGGRLLAFRLINRAVMHHGRRIAEILEERINSILPENRRIDFWHNMLAIVDLLRLRCDRLAGAERDLVGERANDTRLQKERDRDTTQLRADMRIFRNAFESHYLPDNVEEFGFPPVLADVPFELLRQADYLVETQSRPGLVIPDSAVGQGLPLAELVGGIKAAADRLRSSLGATDRELKMAEFAKEDKDDAAADWDQLASWAVRSIRGLFILAGKPGLAAKVLPVTTRRGRSGEAGETSGEDQNEAGPPTDDPTGEPPPGGDPSSTEPAPEPDPSAAAD